MTTKIEAVVNPPETVRPSSRPYAWFVVVLLTLAYAISLLDRWIITLLVEPIKASLGASDTQMGLLMGWAFAIFYVGFGIPMGWLADRNNRRNLIVVCMTLWCTMTVACGLSRSYGQIFFARVGLGVGEAALAPAANSLISDYFPRSEQGAAISFFNMGVAVGMGAAFLCGGFVVSTAEQLAPFTAAGLTIEHPWQLTFILVGLPGLLIAALLLLIREPLRRNRVALDGKDNSSSLRGAIAHVRRRKLAYVTLTLAMGTATLIGYSWVWLPTVFSRSFGIEPAEFAYVYGTCLLICGPIGAITAGQLSSRWYRAGNRSAHYQVTRISLIAMVLLSVAICFSPSGKLALALLAPASLAGAAASAAGSAAVVFVTPNQYRAQITAFYVLTLSLIGLGFGPPLVGWLNDHVFTETEGVRLSVAVVTGIGGALLTSLTFLGAKAYGSAVEELDAASA